MREPVVYPISASPFDPALPAVERHRRILAVSDEVFTDEAGFMVGFTAAADVEALLADRRFGAVAMPILGVSGVTDGPLFDLWSNLMFGKDGEAHRRIRNAVAHEFTPAAIEPYRAQIRDYAERLAAELAAEAELWKHFALPLAARSACLVVGIPEADADEVGGWALDLVNAFGFLDAEMRARAEQAAVAFTGYLDLHLESIQHEPGDDVASRLLASSVQGAHDLTTDEMRALVANLVFGGLDATAKAITAGTYQLIVEGQWGALVGEPNALGHVVAELLRFSPPLAGVVRFVTEDTVVCDVAMKAGQMASLSLTNSCRDPKRFTEPDRLLLDRNPGRQLAFGAGPHFCLGSNLAKIVLESAFAALTGRFHDPVIVGDPNWNFDLFIGITELRISDPV